MEACENFLLCVWMQKAKVSVCLGSAVFEHLLAGNENKGRKNVHSIRNATAASWTVKTIHHIAQNTCLPFLDKFWREEKYYYLFSSFII